MDGILIPSRKLAPVVHEFAPLLADEALEEVPEWKHRTFNPKHFRARVWTVKEVEARNRER